MRIGKRHTLAGCLALLIVGTVPFAHAQRNDIIVVPARARMVRLGFDIQALRGVTLMSYRDTEDPFQPLVHVWNRSRRDWQRADVATLARNANLPVTPERVFVIGPSAIVPEVLLTALDHATEIHSLQTFSVAEILTHLDQTMRFNVEEWRALAKRYDLEITELQRTPNRWGRFGPPRRYREQMEPEPQQRILDAPDISPVQPIAVEPVREIPPAVEPVTTSPEPSIPVAQQEAITPEEEKPAVMEDLMDTSYEDEIVYPEPRTLDTMQLPEKGMYTPPAPPPLETEEDFPIK